VNVLFYGLLAGFATIGGTMLVFYKEGWSRRNSVYLISFAAGIMLATSFLHIIPESMEVYEHAPLLVLVGVIIFYLLESVVMLHPCHDEACEIHRMGIISWIGLTFHSLLDGVAIGLGFEISLQLGIVTALAVLLHELPEGIATTGILMHANLKRTKILLYSLAVALATPTGAVLAYFFLGRLPLEIIGILLALAAGSFIYISAADLIPQIHKRQHKINALILIGGVAVLMALGRLLE
jgi:ZIP family zinc transporter/zinc and cadmium transporter